MFKKAVALLLATSTHAQDISDATKAVKAAADAVATKAVAVTDAAEEALTDIQ